MGDKAGVLELPFEEDVAATAKSEGALGGLFDDTTSVVGRRGDGDAVVLGARLELVLLALAGGAQLEMAGALGVFE